MKNIIDKSLKIIKDINPDNPRLIISLSGWMDAGKASTGTVKYLSTQHNAFKFAEIDPDPFYIYNFPGNMEISTYFRPFINIEDGIISDVIQPENNLYYSEEHDIIYFIGKEPHLRWQRFENLLLQMCREYNVKNILFVGSHGGLIPHSREPRISFSTVSDKMKKQLLALSIRPVDYSGPGSIITSFTLKAYREGIKMASLVAEVPTYIEGYNPRCVVTMIRCLGRLLNQRIDTAELQKSVSAFDREFEAVLENQEDLKDHIQKLEEKYDNEEFNRDFK
ncbi:MAG: PAC2 family protein [Chitinispirillia bacterium]|jgi:predicted ATP-grasp superfamily ATP-dependent carboligase